MTITVRKTPLAIASFLAAALCASTSQAQGTWSAGTAFPTTVGRAAGVWFAPNSHFYAMGGRATDTAGSDFMNPHEYDPVAATWTVKAGTFPDNQNNNMVAGVLVDAGTSYIFCVGGSAAGATTSSTAVRRYDPVADTMTVVATDPWSGAPANTLPGGGAVYNNKLYVLGGFTISIGMTSQIWEFDPARPAGTKWLLKTAALPTPLGYVPCATVGTKIYTGGGSSFTGGTLVDTAASYAYDPVADTIATISSITRATGETKGVNEGGQVWVLGGGRTAPNPSNEVDAYSPVPDSWALAPAFATARRNFAADADPATGKIYIVGGYAPTVPVSTMEIFSPVPLTPFCNPGTGGVMACPCGNPPTGTGRGCNNFGAGPADSAQLTATGSPSLSADTLVFTSTGENNTSLTIFLQGTTSSATGLVYGAGVRCVTGTLKRLYTGGATGGSITRPSGADPSVHVRSAALGDPISAGQARYYMTYYRDPSAAGPCGNTASTFNDSQAGSVLWAP